MLAGIAGLLANWARHETLLFARVRLRQARADAESAYALRLYPACPNLPAVMGTLLYDSCLYRAFL